MYQQKAGDNADKKKEQQSPGKKKGRCSFKFSRQPAI